MGSAISRCNSRNSGPSSGFSEVGQKILDRQPNWLVTPTRWRSHQYEHHQPVRYRTPTPYPKDDRKRLDDNTYSEKILVIEAPTVHHIEAVNNNKSNPHIKLPTGANTTTTTTSSSRITITWECHHPRHARLNRFERPS